MIKNMNNDILAYLPYKSSFLFVDNISFLDTNGVKGEYRLKEDAFFYEDHFAGNPITPGVIITEIMAQIGLVVLGIYLLKEEGYESEISVNDGAFPLLTSIDISFCKIVLPGQKVIVTSQKKYFRFGKLKCSIEMHDESDELIAKGIFSGIIKNASTKIKV